MEPRKRETRFNIRKRNAKKLSYTFYTHSQCSAIDTMFVRVIRSTKFVGGNSGRVFPVWDYNCSCVGAGLLGLTVFVGLHLDYRCSSSFPSTRLSCHLDVVHSVGSEVLHQIRGLWRVGGDAHVLKQVRVVEVDVVATHEFARRRRRRPREADLVR